MITGKLDGTQVYDLIRKLAGDKLAEAVAEAIEEQVDEMGVEVPDGDHEEWIDAFLDANENVWEAYYRQD